MTLVDSLFSVFLLLRCWNVGAIAGAELAIGYEAT